MLKTTLLTAWRQLQQQPVVAAINVLGLTLGLSVFILLTLYVRDELSWERHWQHPERLVRLLTTSINGDSSMTYGGGNAVYLPQLLQEFDAQLPTGARWLSLRDQQIEVDGGTFPGGVAYVDPAFVQLFQLPVLQGDLQQTLAAPNRVALTREHAEQLFGNTDDVLGRQLVIVGRDGLRREYEVTAVYDKPAGHTQVQLTSFTLLHEGVEGGLQESLSAWSGYAESADHYFLLRPDADLASLNAELPAFIDRHLPGAGGRPASASTSIRLQPLLDARFEPLPGRPGQNRLQLAAIAALACVVLGIGILNYTTLATAQSVQRRREIGVRKAAGATNGHILRQFMAESLLYSGLSLLLALVLCELCLPAFATLLGTTLQFKLLSADTLLPLLALALLVGVVGGAWPGLVLSRYRPERVLRRADDRVPGLSLRLRGLLLGLQFSVACGLMLATLVLYAQMNFVRQRDPGFVADDVVAITGFNSGLGQPLTATFRQQVCALSGVTDCALASRWVSSMGGIHGSMSITRRRSDEAAVFMNDIVSDYNFFALYDIPLLAGRSFDPALDQRDPDTRAFVTADGETSEQGRILLNQAAVKALGFASAEEAIGQEVYNRIAYQGEVNYRPQVIIGVVGDTQWLSLREVPPPLVCSLAVPRFAFFIQARVPAAQREAFRTESEALWQQLGGQNTLYFEFAEDNMQAAFAREALEGKLMLGGAALAITLSCLGLFGLVLFELQGRTKEIGVRKVLGAGVLQLVLQFAWRFARPVLLANLVAWPLAGWAMLQWLQRFPYRIDAAALLPAGLLAAALALAVALGTAALATARAASVRPVRSLRSE